MQIFSKLYYFHPCLGYMLGIVPKKDADLQYTYSKNLQDYRESTLYREAEGVTVCRYYHNVMIMLVSF